MANGLIDLEETGTCSTKHCKNEGKRARGARDIEGLVLRTGVFDVPTFRCDDCSSAAAQRSLSPSLAQRRKRGGFSASMFANAPE